MKLFQHMLPQLLTEVPVFVPAQVVPSGELPQKMIGALIAGAISAASGAVSSVAGSRASQVVAREQTLQADIAYRNAAEARGANMATLKYIVPAALVGLTLILIFR